VGDQAQLEDSGVIVDFEPAARFSVTLTDFGDGTSGFGVRFFCEADPQRRVDLGCDDRERAEALCGLLRWLADSIEVSDEGDENGPGA
jgi:hypothetical protein